ncbi:unnamed protein product [Rangifer tarandus platyrhynchus]|uniref:Uncharacterized protein n=2 Tax=Rangifer tarandus platyrhynchus TaxID=3082113 RepID=A0ACB0ESE7_RANTA|nr:unnamed protein product [Rangifer tarandus platyrhynchus]CAI9703610.1 unnamed protein product [Rangifer tarandus platyrhynchus]
MVESSPMGKTRTKQSCKRLGRQLSGKATLGHQASNTNRAGVDLEKPREERSGERRHRRYSHVGPLSGHQRRHASAAAPPASGRFPRTSVPPQPPALHAGNGLPPLLRDINVLKVPASKQNCILGFGVLISRLHFVLNTQCSELAGESERKASPTVVKCRHR